MIPDDFSLDNIVQFNNTLRDYLELCEIEKMEILLIVTISDDIFTLSLSFKNNRNNFKIYTAIENQNEVLQQI